MILNGNLSQAILMLAVPVMINSFIQSMYNLTDTFWLGRIGTENQSAITLVSPFQNILKQFGQRHNNRRCNSYIAIPWCQKR